MPTKEDKLYKVPKFVKTEILNSFSEIPYDIYIKSERQFLTKKIYNNTRNIMLNNRNYNFYFEDTLEDIFQKIYKRGGVYISNNVFIPGKIIHEEYIHIRDNHILILCSRPRNFNKLKVMTVPCILYKTVEVISENIMSNEVKKFVKGDDKLRNTKQKIPYRIMQTGKTNIVDKRTYTNIQQLLKLNPEYDYIFCDDSDCRAFIKEHYGDTYLQHFNRIIPGAVKADFFRYLYMYKVGGVYLDLDTKSISSLKYVIQPENEFVSIKDGGAFNEFVNDNYIYNAIFFIVPDHVLMKEAFSICIDNITEMKNMESALTFTGPGVLGRAYAKHFGKVEVGTFCNGRINIFDLNSGMTKTFTYNGRKIILSKDVERFGLMDHYVTHFAQRNVLRDIEE